MKIAELVAPDCVLLGLRATDKTNVIKDLARRAAKRLGLETNAVVDPLLSREALGSTGIGRGIALPHARIPKLQHFFSLLVRLEKPIDFAAIDEQPVDLVFLLLSPENAGREHLAALASISRLLRNGDVVRGLRGARNTAEFYQRLKEACDLG
jgi:PTS system nitrogen regulatory IIA component